MSDLLDLYKFYGAKFPEGLKATQEAQANAIALQNARRAQQERMDLKDLFAQQDNPSYQAIGAISPEYAQTAMKNQLEMQQAMMGMRHQQAQTGEIEDKMKQLRVKLRAQATAPIVDMYHERLAKNVSPDQALQMFHTESGQALSNLQRQGLIDEDFPSYDAKAITPEAVETAAAGLGVFTRRLQSLQESAKTTAEQQARVNVGPVMTPEQKLGSVEYDPITGLSYIRPPLKGNQPPDANATPADPTTIKKLTLYENMLKAPDATAEEQAFAEAQIIKLSPKENFKAQPQSEIVTPTQLQTKRVEQKAKEEREIKTAQIEATEKAADKKAIETYFRGPKPEVIRNLIKESIEGDVQSGLARLGKFFGVAVPGGDALAALKVIQQQMARSLPYAPGGASDIDVRNRLEMISNPATDEPIVDRLRALEEVIRDAEAYVVQKGDFLSEDQILDSIKNGYLSEASALEMLNNRMLNKGNPIYAPTQGNKTSTGVK